MSELLRRAIDEHLAGKAPVSERLGHLKVAAGLWKDRDDIGDSVEYTKRLRSPIQGR